MTLKGLIDTDFVNYKVPCMVLEFPKCDFKCDHECGKQVCQNGALAATPDIAVPDDVIIKRYLDNPITQAICMQGLEPFDTSVQMMKFINKFRQVSNDDVVIYTGYNKDEISDLCLGKLKELGGIVIKYGRYIPNQKQHFDNVLRVYLASDNQYAERL